MTQMTPISITFSKTHPHAVIPKYQTHGSSGMDLHACVDSDVLIESGKARIIPVGLKVACHMFSEDQHYELQIRSRSGLAANHGISVMNSPGTVDADYTGPLSVILHNAGQLAFTVKHGDRIAQLVIAPVFGFRNIRTVWVDSPGEGEGAYTPDAILLASKKARGSGGFGSTGK